MRKQKFFAHILLLGFLLGIHQGRIALWKSEDPEPCRIFPYPASALPPDIRQALEKGIQIEDAQALDRLLESFCS